MPYPILLALSAATTAASAGLGMAAQSEQQSAISKARNAELSRQAQFQKQANQVVEQSLADSSRPQADQQLDAAAQNRQQRYNDIIAPVQTGTAAPVNTTVASSPTATATAQSQAITAAWNRILGGAQAKLGSYNDWNLGTSIKNTRANQELGLIGTNSRASENVLNGELDQAGHAGAGLSQIGDILGAVGNVAGTAAATRVSPAANGTGWGAADFDPVAVGSLSPEEAMRANAWNRIVR